MDFSRSLDGFVDDVEANCDVVITDRKKKITVNARIHNG